MSAAVTRQGDGWAIACEPCAWTPAPIPVDSPNSRPRADESAAVHNSDVHLSVKRPEWAEVARWADTQRSAGASS